uniref:C2H2-type domain-containing protein n=1 Tax=Haemonchus contortus TaxID=6289 RepID=A0A7I4XVQ9_HAECO
MSPSNGRPPSANDNSQPMFVNNIKFEVDDDEMSTGIEMMSGETRGPFPVKELRMSNSETEFAIMLVDQMGNKHYFDVDSMDPLIKRIKPCPNALEANCILFHVESLIQILITRDVHYGDDLVAIFLPQQQPSTASEDSEKRYPCPKCHVAKFNNIDNLNAHQKFYCKGNPRVVVAAPPTLVPSIRHGTAAVAAPQNVILVPIAYHEHQHEMVQLLGPPQTIVPVAIGRPSVAQNGVPQLAVPLTEPLLVHRSLCGVVRTPAKLQFAIGDLAVTIPIVPIEMSGLSAGLKRTMERPTSIPLDLSKRRREHDSGSSGSTTPTNVVRASHSDVEKPFVCACGISFSADETLKAHRQYYCKLVERDDDTNKEPPKKDPL